MMNGYVGAVPGTLSIQVPYATPIELQGGWSSGGGLGAPLPQLLGPMPQLLGDIVDDAANYNVARRTVGGAIVGTVLGLLVGTLALRRPGLGTLIGAGAGAVIGLGDGLWQRRFVDRARSGVSMDQIVAAQGMQ